MDRIARQARTSNERVYAYFRGKEALYAHVSLREPARVAQATPMDPAGPAGLRRRLFDHFTVTHPDHHRLITWGRLEPHRYRRSVRRRSRSGDRRPQDRPVA
ncbi:TetR family transcriptional regulator [Streptomyces mirabilis]|nr:TetR family transcriptional regulator [Streptomyces mirabilis]